MGNSTDKSSAHRAESVTDGIENNLLGTQHTEDRRRIRAQHLGASIQQVRKVGDVEGEVLEEVSSESNGIARAMKRKLSAVSTRNHSAPRPRRRMRCESNSSTGGQEGRDTVIGMEARGDARAGVEGVEGGVTVDEGQASTDRLWTVPDGTIGIEARQDDYEVLETYMNLDWSPEYTSGSENQCALYALEQSMNNFVVYEGGGGSQWTAQQLRKVIVGDDFKKWRQTRLLPQGVFRGDISKTMDWWTADDVRDLVQYLVCEGGSAYNFKVFIVVMAPTLPRPRLECEEHQYSDRNGIIPLIIFNNNNRHWESMGPRRDSENAAYFESCFPDKFQTPRISRFSGPPRVQTPPSNLEGAAGYSHHKKIEAGTIIRLEPQSAMERQPRKEGLQSIHAPYPKNKLVTLPANISVQTVTAYLGFSNTRQFWACLAVPIVSEACRLFREHLENVQTKHIMTDLVAFEGLYDGDEKRDERLQLARLKGYAASAADALAVHLSMEESDRHSTSQRRTLAASIIFHLIEDIESSSEWVADATAMDAYINCILGAQHDNAQKSTDKEIGTPDLTGVQPTKPTLGPVLGLVGEAETMRDKFARAIQMVKCLNRLNAVTHIKTGRSPMYKGCSLAKFGSPPSNKFFPKYMVKSGQLLPSQNPATPDLLQLALSPEPDIPKSRMVYKADLARSRPLDTGGSISSRDVVKGEYPTYFSSGAAWRDNMALVLRLKSRQKKFEAIRMLICPLGTSMSAAYGSITTRDNATLLTIFRHSPSGTCPEAQQWNDVHNRAQRVDASKEEVLFIYSLIGAGHPYDGFASTSIFPADDEDSESASSEAEASPTPSNTRPSARDRPQNIGPRSRTKKKETTDSGSSFVEDIYGERARAIRTATHTNGKFSLMQISEDKEARKRWYNNCDEDSPDFLFEVNEWAIRSLPEVHCTRTDFGSDAKTLGLASFIDRPAQEPASDLLEAEDNPSPSNKSPSLLPEDNPPLHENGETEQFGMDVADAVAVLDAENMGLYRHGERKGLSKWKIHILPNCYVLLLDHQLVGVVWLLLQDFGCIPEELLCRIRETGQRKARRIARRLRRTTPVKAGILADGMGLGKTRTIAAYLAVRSMCRPEGVSWKPALAQVPVGSCPGQWAKEIKLFRPYLQPIFWLGHKSIQGHEDVYVLGKGSMAGPAARNAFRRRAGCTTVIITTHHTFRSRSLEEIPVDSDTKQLWRSRIRDKISVMIVDEGDVMRNYNSYHLATRLARPETIFLVTGTPIIRELSDLVKELAVMWPSIKRGLKRHPLYSTLDKSDMPHRIGLDKLLTLPEGDWRLVMATNPRTLESLLANSSDAEFGAKYRLVEKWILLRRTATSIISFKDGKKVHVSTAMPKVTAHTYVLRPSTAAMPELQMNHERGSINYLDGLLSGGRGKKGTPGSRPPPVTAALRELAIAAHSSTQFRFGQMLRVPSPLHVPFSDCMPCVATLRESGFTGFHLIAATHTPIDMPIRNLSHAIGFLSEGSLKNAFICKLIHEYSWNKETKKMEKKVLVMMDTPSCALNLQLSLQLLGIPVAVLHSSLKTKERAALVDDFNSPSVRDPIVLIMMYAIGSQGTNLDGDCQLVILANSSLSVGLERQAYHRIIRASQEKDVRVVKLVVANSNDIYKERRKVERAVQGLAAACHLDDHFLKLANAVDFYLDKLDEHRKRAPAGFEYMRELGCDTPDKLFELLSKAVMCEYDADAPHEPDPTTWKPLSGLRPTGEQPRMSEAEMMQLFDELPEPARATQPPSAPPPIVAWEDVFDTVKRTTKEMPGTDRIYADEGYYNAAWRYYILHNRIEWSGAGAVDRVRSNMHSLQVQYAIRCLIGDSQGLSDAMMSWGPNIRFNYLPSVEANSRALLTKEWLGKLQSVVYENVIGKLGGDEVVQKATQIAQTQEQRKMNHGKKKLPASYWEQGIETDDLEDTDEESDEDVEESDGDYEEPGDNYEESDDDVQEPEEESEEESENLEEDLEGSDEESEDDAEEPEEDAEEPEEDAEALGGYDDASDAAGNGGEGEVGSGSDPDECFRE